MIDKKKVSYVARGRVLGLLWGGGQGWYPADVIRGESREGVKATIQEQLNSGALDSGMGFRRLLRAKMVIEAQTTIWVGGKVYHRSDFEEVEFEAEETTNE